jgi:cell wall-associated NlpC family hydrolase
MTTYQIMSRKAHMRTFCRAHGLRIPKGSFTLLWAHWGAASIYVLEEIQRYCRMAPTGVWDAQLQKVLFPPSPVKATPAALAMYCHYHGQPNAYTQNLTLRWWGIIHRVRAWKMTRYADCSSFFKWLYFACGWPDPNGDGYALDGNTDSMIVKGTRVDAPAGNDAVFYRIPGGSRPEHMAIYVGDGMVISHGVPGPPQYLPVAEMGGLEIMEYRHYAAT